jgi:hypothetical protein
LSFEVIAIMKTRIILPVLLFFSISTTSKAQVLISLLFGDALNTDKIEFGLTGGLNRSYFNDIQESEGLNNFNLGFYFHIMLKESSFLSTGVLVKSNVGATGMPTYPLGDADFDGLFEEGTLTTKINTFYVPIMWHQRFNNRWFLEGGFQAGLRSKAYDYFDTSLLDGDLNFKKNVSDSYTRLDAGAVGGVGYKFKKELKSMSAGVLYYYGFVDVNKDPDVLSKNSSLNFYLRIPIGAGK